MRAALLFMVLLPLTSCIPVEDFGAYWDRAEIDTRLAGKWTRVTASPGQDREHGYPIGDVISFVIKDRVYEVTVRDKRGTIRDKPAYPVKTLSVGNYRFLAYGPRQGIIVRYRVSARTLEWCFSDGPSTVEFVNTHYPRAANIKQAKGEGTYLGIGLFDSEVFEILSRIPDQDTYWACEAKFDRTF